MRVLSKLIDWFLYDRHLRHELITIWRILKRLNKMIIIKVWNTAFYTVKDIQEIASIDFENEAVQKKMLLQLENGCFNSIYILAPGRVISVRSTSFNFALYLYETLCTIC